MKNLYHTKRFYQVNCRDENTLKIADSVSHAPRLNLSYDLLTVNELKGITMASLINNPHTPYI